MSYKLNKILVITSLFLMISILQGIGQTTIKSGASLVQVYSSTLFYEGPTWDPVTGKLYFSTPNNSPYNVYRLDTTGQASIWYANSQRVNGTFLTKEGRLLTAEQGSPRICSYRIGLNGPEDAKILASDPAWNYPNDLCQRKQGDIYFTSVNWEGKATGVYRISTAGVVSKVISDMNMPNGIETSLDGMKLYVSDSGLRYWKVYTINTDGSIGTGSIFFNPVNSSSHVPDGMTIDERGNLYFIGKGGLWIVSPAGAQLDFIAIPETSSNVTFGGINGTTLYITCQNKVYSLETTVHGGYWTSPNITPTPTPTNIPGILGDVNGNGMVDIVDALLIAQYSTGQILANFNVSLGDVNCSGSVDIVDALITARYVTGLINELICQ